jgi:hypothetical protein
VIDVWEASPSPFSPAGKNSIPWALKTANCRESPEILAPLSTVAGMITIVSTVISILALRFRRRASMEVELIGLRPIERASCQGCTQVGVSSSGRLTSLDLSLPGLAAGPRRHGVGKAGNRGPVASQRPSDILVTPSAAARDESQNP